MKLRNWSWLAGSNVGSPANSFFADELSQSIMSFGEY